MPAMGDEVVAGLRRLVLPLAGSPLGSVNAYLVAGADGPILIDTGWRTPETLAALAEGLAAIGRRPEDLATIVLTHAHPDHCGLAAELRARSGAPILLHLADWPLADPARLHGEAFMWESAAWFARHGMPEGEQGGVRAARRALVERNPPFTPDRALIDGETLTLGPFAFTVRWMPGHAPGQVCLHEERARFLIAGDHVLPTISPNVGLYTDEAGDPLGDYLASLARVRDLSGRSGPARPRPAVHRSRRPCRRPDRAPRGAAGRDPRAPRRRGRDRVRALHAPPLVGRPDDLGRAAALPARPRPRRDDRASGTPPRARPRGARGARRADPLPGRVTAPPAPQSWGE